MWRVHKVEGGGRAQPLPIEEQTESSGMPARQEDVSCC